jgi:hypothetical protein
MARLVTVKGSEKNYPNLRKGISDKSVEPFIPLILFYFKVMKHVINSLFYFLEIQSEHFKIQFKKLFASPHSGPVFQKNCKN